jgi:mannose-6-phosphate isomerase
LKLKIGESFVISPDEPHAYISGDLIESMVSSDNVVRGGLTPKFKDTKTL